jgi:ferrous iron transport protein A
MDIISLDKLPLEHIAKIHDLKCSGDTRRRMLDLGIIKNTLIKPVLRSPSGDPTAFEIRGTIIALRKEDTRFIDIVHNEKATETSP